MKTDATLTALFPEANGIPEAYRLGTGSQPAPIRQDTWLVDGEIRHFEGPAQEVLSPICIRSGGELKPVTLGSYPLMGEKEALEALDAAQRAYDNGCGLWPTMSVGDRIRHLEEFAVRMKEKRAEVVKRLVWEIAKSIPDAEKEFDRTVEYIRDTVQAMKELDRASSRFSIEGGIIAQIRRAPLGVVLCMGPYNYPLNETFTTLIPALLMGNTIVFKPPKIGVLLHEPLLEAFRDSFPRGVVNTVYGRGQTIITPIIRSGRVDVLAFIGSSRAADVLKTQHPKPHRMRGVLGLDAKNAAIILEDADVELAAKEVILGALSFNGQRCTALKMIFVHQKIRAVFLEKLVAGVNALKRGMPWDAGVQITPLPRLDQVEQQCDYVADALSNGATVVNPGGGDTAGTFFNPAVIFPATKAMKLWKVEQFGPTIPVAEFSDINEPIRYVIESDFGQQASVFGTDPAVLGKLIDPLVNQVCRVNLNCQCQRGPDVYPFTGRKDSAEGTLSVSDALRIFSIRTLLAAKENGANKRILSSILEENLSNFLSTDFLF